MVNLLHGQTDESMSTRPLIWHYPHYDNQGGEPSSLIRLGQYKLIHYHLDGRDELYNLTDDPSEQNDIAASNEQRATTMREMLLDYLSEVGAMLPEPDPRFDAVKHEATMKRNRGEFKKQLERNHAQMLDANYQPNPTWWGSSVD